MVKKTVAVRHAEEASAQNTATSTTTSGAATSSSNPSRRTEMLRIAALILAIPVMVGLSSGDTIKNYLQEPALNQTAVSRSKTASSPKTTHPGEVDFFASEPAAAIVTAKEDALNSTTVAKLSDEALPGADSSLTGATLDTTASVPAAVPATILTAAPITAPPITAPPVTAPPANFVTNNNIIADPALPNPVAVPPPPPPQQTTPQAFLPLPISQELTNAALQFVQGRQQAYRDADQYQNWKLRGNGYMYTFLNIALAARTVALQDTTTTGRHQVQIFNVHPQVNNNNHPSGPNYCELLSIWVRASGPELVAGKAQPVSATPSSACHWVFDLDLPVPGSYKIDARVVLWNGLAPLEFYESLDVPKQNNACPNSHAGNIVPPNERAMAPQNTSLLGFKMYGPFQACCEVCRRTHGCQFWATPPALLPEPSGMRTGCELWFPPTQRVEDIPTTRLMPDVVQQMTDQIAKRKAKEAADAAAAAGDTPQRLRRQRQRRRLDVQDSWGSPDSNITSVTQFLGCGWSFYYTLEFPCLSGDLDDMVFVEHNGTVVVAQPPQPQVIPQAQLPLCQKTDESMLQRDTGAYANKGRWVREPWPTPDICPDLYKVQTGTELAFHMNEFNADHPHCWHRYDLTSLNKKCFEMNCAMIKPNGKWLSAPLQQETQWMGAFKNYQCDYMEFTNQQLSECFQKKKITEIKYEGASIGNNFRQFFSVRLEKVPFYQGPDGKFVTVSSLTWPHLLWHNTVDMYKVWLEDKKNMDAVLNSDETYWVTPYFISSEREPYVQMERALEFAKHTEAILTPKGYTMIDAFDLSATFTVRDIHALDRVAFSIFIAFCVWAHFSFSVIFST